MRKRRSVSFVALKETSASVQPMYSRGSLHDCAMASCILPMGWGGCSRLEREPDLVRVTGETRWVGWAVGQHYADEPTLNTDPCTSWIESLSSHASQRRSGRPLASVAVFGLDCLPVTESWLQ